MIRNLLNHKSAEGVEKLEDTIKEALLQKKPGFWSKVTSFFGSISQKFSRIDKKK